VLAITAPASKSLGSIARPAPPTPRTQLGSVQVSDGRGALLGAWTTSVTRHDFTTGAATANETITKTNAEYWSGAERPRPASARSRPASSIVANQVDVGVLEDGLAATVVVGNTTQAGTRRSRHIPAAAVAGAYTRHQYALVA